MNKIKTEKHLPKLNPAYKIFEVCVNDKQGANS
jgi:hypothetical protein